MIIRLTPNREPKHRKNVISRKLCSETSSSAQAVPIPTDEGGLAGGQGLPITLHCPSTTPRAGLPHNTDALYDCELGNTTPLHMKCPQGHTYQTHTTGRRYHADHLDTIQKQTTSCSWPCTSSAFDGSAPKDKQQDRQQRKPQHLNIPLRKTCIKATMAGTRTRKTGSGVEATHGAERNPLAAPRWTICQPTVQQPRSCAQPRGIPKTLHEHHIFRHRAPIFPHKEHRSAQRASP